MAPEESFKKRIQRILISGVLAVSVATWFCVIGVHSGIWLLAAIAAAAYGVGYSLRVKTGHWFLSADGTAIPTALAAYITTALIMHKSDYLPPWRPDNLESVVMAFPLAWIAGHLFSAIWVFIGEWILNMIYREQLAMEKSALSAYWSCEEDEERSGHQ